VNERGEVIGIQSKLDQENRQVVREKRQEGKDWESQKWNIVYKDDDDKDGGSDSGYNKDWGMHVNREFHIVSEAGENRRLDLVSNRLVIKTPTNRPSQIFKFDIKTGTIKSKGYSTAFSHSIDMRNTWLYVYGTGSQWH
jgi:hypothetical protein